MSSSVKPAHAALARAVRVDPAVESCRRSHACASAATGTRTRARSVCISTGSSEFVAELGVVERWCAPTTTRPHAGRSHPGGVCVARVTCRIRRLCSARRLGQLPFRRRNGQRPRSNARPHVQACIHAWHIRVQSIAESAGKRVRAVRLNAATVAYDGAVQGCRLVRLQVCQDCSGQGARLASDGGLV